uniref:Phycobiliprotein ApcE n=1 Tax=Sciadococcus taiwanensis TaxID=3028030 RepID=A0A9Y1I282_9RHOD|nr:phycobillisome linker protein [Sciadococcus taiwanensis]
MSVQISSGSPLSTPQLYKTASMAAISLAEKQDRFLNPGELNDLITYLRSGAKRLDIVKVLSLNANTIISRAADRIFVGGSPLSFLERPQAAVTLTPEQASATSIQTNRSLQSGNIFQNLFRSGAAAPAGFRPINVVRYGPMRMRKSMRDLDWFLRYLTYAIVAGDPNILSVNTQGLRELIENACSSAAAIVALREMRNTALALFENDKAGEDLVREYFNTLIKEFEAPAASDKIRKRTSSDLQGLRLPQIYVNASKQTLRFVMKPNFSSLEKRAALKACYRQVFERDIKKAYDLTISDLESKVMNGQISIKEFIRALGKSNLYRKDFYESFVNSRVVELAFRHFLGRGISSIEEFQKYFGIVSNKGLPGLVDALVNSEEYADYFGEETVPYLRGLGDEPLECRNWGVQISLFNYSAPFRKVPQFITLFSDYKEPLPEQHPYGKGNDPLPIQFGAIFAQEQKNSKTRPALFTKDARRILIRKGPGIKNQLSSPQMRSQEPGSLGPKVFKYGAESISVDSITQASYLRVFGRDIYEEEKILLKPLENELRRGSIRVREFIRQLAKSEVFRSLYWSNFYICKAIEYIHIRLLGRPTYGRKEINQYFDLAYKNGFYLLIDSIIDSQEYLECFGEDIVPYERYTTSTGAALQTLRSSVVRFNSYRQLPTKLDRFIELGEVKEVRSNTNIQNRITQGVNSQRNQKVVFKVQNYKNEKEVQIALRAAFRQVFERDIEPYIVGNEFIKLETLFKDGQIAVKELVEALGTSELYVKEFYNPYPNTQVIEFGTKHFLGRAPKNQAEIRYYNQILAAEGIKGLVSAMVNSGEYEAIFNQNIVPYRRFPTLPAANFPNTEKLYNRQTKQSSKIIVPSFEPTEGNQ